MTDKFLGVGGTDGTHAKPLKMDVEGNLEVRDVDVKTELELIKDQQAEILARLDEPIDAQLTGSIPEDATIEQIINSVTVPAGGNTGWVTINPLGAKKIVLGVVSDKSWKLETNRLIRPEIRIAGGNVHIHPDVFSVVQNANNENNPKVVVPGFFLGDASSLLDAIDKQFIPADLRVIIYNESNEDATVKVKMMRIWEV